MHQDGERNRVIVNQYRGQLTSRESHSRDVTLAEVSWNNSREREQRLEFDHLLLSCLQRAEREGRTEIVIVDIGSGDSQLFWDYYDEPGSLPESRQFLKAHPTFRIRLVGLTDATNQDQFLKRKDDSREAYYQAKDINVNQVSIRTVYYTLTANQRLDYFLTKQDIDKVDLFLATWSLTYLGPRTFHHVLHDAITRLRPGAQMLVSAYQSDVMGYRRDPSYPVALNVRDKTDDTEAKSEPSVEEALTEWFSYRDMITDILNQSQITDQEVSVVLKKVHVIISFLKGRGVISDEDVRSAQREANRLVSGIEADWAKLPTAQHRPSRIYFELQRISIWAPKIINSGFAELFLRQQKRISAAKKATLEKLIREFKGKADITYKEAFIDINKLLD